MKERHNSILEYITTHGKTEVSILAERLHTSEVTIRKDLDLLEEKGMLKRERGYAVPNDPGNIFYRMAFHPDLKQRIARTAADCVSDGETVMIETGSTCILFAEELARTRKNVTIVTNSVCLAEYVRKYTNVQLILLGGILQSQSQSLVGPLTKASAGAFHVDKLFTGTDGYSRGFGFTGDDMTRSDTLSAMAASAEHIYVLTDSGNFHAPEPYPFSVSIRSTKSSRTKGSHRRKPLFWKARASESRSPDNTNIFYHIRRFHYEILIRHCQP